MCKSGGRETERIGYQLRSPHARGRGRRGHLREGDTGSDEEQCADRSRRESPDRPLSSEMRLKPAIELGAWRHTLVSGRRMAGEALLFAARFSETGAPCFLLPFLFGEEFFQ